MIIPNPDYNKYFIDCKFSFTNKIKNCISLNSFLEKSNQNSIIDEIIRISNNYFNNKIYHAKLYYKNIIFKLFNISKINSNEFECYDLVDKKRKYITMIENKYYIDNMLIVAVKRILKWMSKAGFSGVFVGFIEMPFVIELHSV